MDLGELWNLIDKRDPLLQHFLEFGFIVLFLRCEQNINNRTSFRTPYFLILNLQCIYVLHISLIAILMPNVAYQTIITITSQRYQTMFIPKTITLFTWFSLSRDAIIFFRQCAYFVFSQN